MSGAWNRHNANGGRRPKGVNVDHIVHVRGGGQELIARADRVDWRNVSSWRGTDQPITPIEQGYAAFLSGKPKDANPFGDTTPWSANKWIDGWTRARRDRK